MDTLWQALGGSVIAAVLLGLWMNSFFGPYLRKKAENIATLEDIQALVEQVRETERVKAEISDQVWGRQAAWNAKSDLHVAIVQQLSSALTSISQVREQYAIPTNDNLEKVVSDLMDRFHTARLFVSDESLNAMQAAVQAFSEIAEEVRAGKQQTGTVATYRERLTAYINAARCDLGYGPSAFKTH